MSGFELKSPKWKFRLASRWDIFSILLLIGSLCLAGYYLVLFLNPSSALNPFPPPPEPTLIVLTIPTPTITPRQLPPTWTPSATIEPTATRTPAPTLTPPPTATLYVMKGVKTPTPSRTPKPNTPYYASAPTYLSSTIYHPESGCNWLGVAGQAVDKNNSPVLYLVVKLGGSIGGREIDLLTLSGTAPAYGQSGFEFVIADQPIASNGTLWIQLLEQGDKPLTDKVYFNTYADCNKNLILIRFTKQ